MNNVKGVVLELLNLKLKNSKNSDHGAVLAEAPLVLANFLDKAENHEQTKKKIKMTPIDDNSFFSNEDVKFCMDKTTIFFEKKIGAKFGRDNFDLNVEIYDTNKINLVVQNLLLNAKDNSSFGVDLIKFGITEVCRVYKENVFEVGNFIRMLDQVNSIDHKNIDLSKELTQLVFKELHLEGHGVLKIKQYELACKTLSGINAHGKNGLSRYMF